MKMNKPNCFTQAQWDYYKQDVPFVKNGKTLDVCFDCTVEYQKLMRLEGKCQFPTKNLTKVVEYV